MASTHCALDNAAMHSGAMVAQVSKSLAEMAKYASGELDERQPAPSAQLVDIQGLQLLCWFTPCHEHQCTCSARNPCCNTPKPMSLTARLPSAVSCQLLGTRFEFEQVGAQCPASTILLHCPSMHA